METQKQDTTIDEQIQKALQTYALNKPALAFTMIKVLISMKEKEAYLEGVTDTCNILSSGLQEAKDELVKKCKDQESK